MDPGLPRDRISDPYHRALACSPEERRAFLEEACDGDVALRTKWSPCSASSPIRRGSSRLRRRSLRATSGEDQTEAR